MLSNYFPYEYANSVFDISYKKLYKQGYRGIIFDIDNTLVHHNDPSNDKIDALFRHLHKIGFKTVLLTNNDEPRVKHFIKNIDTEYVCDACKPERSAYMKALEKLGLPKEQTVAMGDQMFIDIIGANRCGIPTIMIHYIPAPGEKWVGFRRCAERVILTVYSFSRKYRHRLGNILRQKEN